MEQAGPQLRSSHRVSLSRTHRQGTSICPPPGKVARSADWSPPAPCVTLDKHRNSAMRSGHSPKDRGQSVHVEAQG